MERGFLEGYRTYITAFAGILAGWAGYAVGAPVLGNDFLTLADAVQFTMIGLVSVFLRKGINSATAPIREEQAKKEADAEKAEMEAKVKEAAALIDKFRTKQQ